MLSGVMVLSLGLAAACSDDESDENETTTTSEDTQTILNGNFEYFDTGDDDAYIIATPDSWSESSSGNTNYVMNGIIDTSESGWEAMTNPELGYTLAYNNALDDDDDDYDDLYVDYNDMSASDIVYSNARSALTDESYFTIFEDDDGTYIYTDEYDALLSSDADGVMNSDTKQYVTGNSDGTYTYTDSDGETVTVYAKTLIDNPLTHNYLFDITDNGDGTATGYTEENEGGDTVTLYVDDDGNYYYDEDKTEPYGSHVLMIHNYVNKSNGSAINPYGNAQSYSSSTTIELDPNTAAVFSVWVKTTELTYGRNGSPAENMNGGDDLGNLGAYISVEQSVGGNSVGSFSIEGINTHDVAENNGWVQYTVYLRACDFSSTSFTITLGLGIGDDYTYAVAGYAFFDDVECTVYPTINECFEETDSDLTSEDDFKDIGAYVTLDDLVDDDWAFNTYTDDNDVTRFNTNTFYINFSDYDVNDMTERNTVDLEENTIVGLTQDDDYYVTSKEFPTNVNVEFNEDKDVYQNANLDISTADDVIAAFSLGEVSSLKLGNYTSTIQRLFVDEDNDFSFVNNIPDADANTTALVILSARGAAYTATITDSSAFTVNSDGYKIVSFWVKTSDMDGFTAGTINIVYKDSNGDIVSTSTLTVDTTDVQFDAGEYEDIYNGWVQCFFYVENPVEDSDDLEFYLEFCFGNTTIKDTSSSDYKSGYVAIANITTFDVSEDVFNLTSTGDYAAAFSFEETDNRENNFMDTVVSSKNNEIEENITTPSSYEGVYGGSANTVYRDTIDPSGYEASNANANAGLINQDYFGNYINNSYEWLQYLLETSCKTSIINDGLTEAANIWNAIFGFTCVQPLLIVNTIEYFESAGVYAMNYGFQASSATTVSSASYQAITVRAYVSAGAVAYIYLMDDTTEVSSFDLPAYSFWYDTVGNVLDSEPDYDDENYDATDHVVYYLRSDGLYEDADGNLFANLYNYSRVYLDNITYFDIDGEDYTVNQVDNDTIYYASEEEAAKAKNGDSSAIQANHYLVAYDSDGDMTRVFYYGDPNDTGEVGYYYIVTETDDDGNATISYTGTVSNFDLDKVEVRYDYSENSQLMYVCIDARYDENGNLFGGKSAEEADISELGYDANGKYVANKWTTVTFYVHTGDEDKSYTLELWSGARDVSGVGDNGAITDSGSVKGSFVAFDYSALTTDEDTYATQLAEYEDKIINSYIKLFNDNGLLTGKLIASAEENISYYEKLFDQFVASGDLSEDDRPAGYTALYYTYSLYDDQDYVPFNADTAEEGLVGYDYDIDDYDETLVYLSYYNYSDSAVSVFLDYSATDVTIDTDAVDEEDEEEDEDESGLTVWLLVTSIILAVVLIFTLISILARDLWKKARRKRKLGKNVYSSKRKHYIRKLKLTEESADGLDDKFEGGEPAETSDAEEESAEPEEKPDDEDDGEQK